MLNKILPKLFSILVLSGWVNTLHANCSEDETKAIITQEIGELKKKGFFDFKHNFGPPHQEYERRYYFTAKKKDSLGIDQVYGGLLVMDIRVCSGPKALNLERLKPLFISDFIKPRLGTDEGCSWDAAKIIFYEYLNKSDEYTKWEYPYGIIMKSWEYYEFLYIETTSDSRGRKYNESLGRMEISKNSCSIKYNDVILIWDIWRNGSLNGDQ